MLRWRLVAAASIIIPFLGLLWLDASWNLGVPGLWIIPIGWLVTIIAAAEILDLMRAGGHRPAAWSVYVGVSLLFLAGCAPAGWNLVGKTIPADCPLGTLGYPLFASAAALALAMVAEMLRFRQPGGAIVGVAVTLLVIVYAGLSMAFVAQLRLFHNNAWGMAALISLVFVVKTSDAGAYASGKLFGRHQMSPTLSPKKTIEGAVGGLLFAVLSSWFYFALVVPWFIPEAQLSTPWWASWLYGLVVASAGMVGDLAASLLKRDVGRKDSSSWLPGLGGVLDVMDSILLAAPAALFCWMAGLVGPS